MDDCIDDNLVDVCNLLYDELDWTPRGFAVARRERHSCRDGCHMLNVNRLYVCVKTGNIHICTDGSCDLLINTQESKVCTLTGNSYDHEERVIFAYDNADVRPDVDIDVDDGITDAQREQDLIVQLRLAQRCLVQSDVVVIKRRRHQTSQPSVPMQLPEQPATKKMKPTAIEIADETRHEVYALAITFLMHLKVDVNIIDVLEIAIASQHTWSYIQDTQLYKANEHKYQPRCHVAVMLRCIQMDGLAYGSRVFAPRIEALSLYFKCPRIFATPQFDVPSSKFTACSTILRKCLAEKAKMILDGSCN